MLQAAHRGYAYQDLLTATRLTDVLLGDVIRVDIDSKLVSDDRFDDLTAISADGRRERAQFKNLSSIAPLDISSFTTDGRSLKLDALLASALADRAGPGARARAHQYRVVMRDSRPVHPVLLHALRTPPSDPGPFVPGMNTVRLQFEPDALWPTASHSDATAKATSESFAFLRDGRFNRTDLTWFCTHTVVELEAPAASFDLTNPGAAERFLIERVTRDIGAGSYPNENRSPVDVAAALIRAASAARAGVGKITVDELLRQAQLRQDFGSVSREHPIDIAVEVSRRSAAADVGSNAALAADRGVPLLVVGPPGQGKSWICQRVQDELNAAGWLVAEHYCFLGDADVERQARVHADRVIGSLLHRLADADPTTVAAQRPRFSSDNRLLEEAVKRARDRSPDRRVALLIDGLDHVTRVLGKTSGLTDPSAVLAERISTLKLPPGSVTVVFTQPGEHLKALRDANAAVMDMPGLEPNELQQLAQRWLVLELSAFRDSSVGASEGSIDRKKATAFLGALRDRSAGNALYATYLCREVLRAPASAIDPINTLLSLPIFDGTLAAYYAHLARALDEGRWVADIVALLDFSVSRTELRDMRPSLANRIDPALDQLGPVLIERAMQGGIRVYHESFARFWLEEMANDAASNLARLREVAAWLSGKGLFNDSRAYRFLLPTLARANRLHEVVAVVDVDFVSKSVAAGFTTSAIQANLATAAKCAASLNDWPAVVRCIELSRAAEAYEYERLDTTLVEFADVAMGLLGAQTFASRLLYDGRTTVPARAGLKLCSQIDAAGVSAPWAEYLTSYDRERKEDRTIYGDSSDREIALAALRGRLRQKASSQGSAQSVDLRRLAGYVEEAELAPAQIVDLISATLGVTATTEFISHLQHPGPFALALAEAMLGSADSALRQRAPQLAESAINNDDCAGEVHRLFRFGIEAAIFEPTDLKQARKRLLDLTRDVQKHGIQFEAAPVFRWLDACAIAARRDLLGLATAEALLQGEGWYRCWLRFAISLCRAEAQAPEQRPSESIAALKLLIDDLRPFVGDPRACDLYRLQNVITSTLQRALSLVSDPLWLEATRILTKVCNEVSTTISGEMGGPLARDTLLHLIVSASNGARYKTNEAIIAKTLSEESSRRYYADIAGFHLLAARLALRSGEPEKAKQHWETASKLLVAYGWRKDRTIFGLIDPLDELIAVDRDAVQRRLEVLQPLCERVLFHTDRKETRHARPQWWALLAAADPLALAGLVTPELLRRCNMPYEELEEARTDLWRAQRESGDSFLAGACRLTLEDGLDPDDAPALDKLAKAHAPLCEVVDLMRLLVSRADERPIRYSYSNSAELVETDLQRVDEINQIAAKSNLPTVSPFPLQSALDNPGSPLTPHGGRQTGTPLIESLQVSYSTDFDVGIKGLSRAIDLWQRRPYDTGHERWAVDRFLNAIGYRLLELLQEGKNVEAELAIRALADAVSLSSDRHLLLGDVGDGLAKCGFSHHALLAFTLHWTRTRGHGGWLNFGGETNLHSLRKAAKLDPQGTLEILASEVDRALRGRYGTLGISEALMLALGTIDWGRNVAWPNSRTAVQLAFLTWDEAAKVIGERLPRIDSNDDPDLPYSRAGRPITHHNPVDAALTFMTFAGIGHPSREQKRRSLLAIQATARVRTELACEALNMVFTHLTEPATLDWLLTSLQNIESRKVLAERTRDHLLRLSKSPYLAVRANARKLLSEVEAISEAPPLFDPIPELMGRTVAPLWTPEQEDIDSTTNATPSPNARKAEFALRDAAKVRITLAQEHVPNLQSAATAELIRVFSTESHEKRLRNQLELLSSRAEFRWPDAFIAPYEASEEVLQRLGGTSRAARALAGAIIPDPVEWELRLATLLSNRTDVPLGFEFTRIPRPDYPAPPGHNESIWADMSSVATKNEATSTIATAVRDSNGLSGTTFVKQIGALPISTDPRYKGWRAIAILETRISSPQASWPAKDAITVSRCAAIEQRQAGNIRGMDSPPIGGGDLRSWVTTYSEPTLPKPDRTGPLVVTDSRSAETVDGSSALGYSCTPLALTHSLVRGLGLLPGNRLFELIDGDGLVAIVSRSWRAGYTVSDYEMKWPLLCGTDILIRPDIFDRLGREFGSTVVWREYLEGDLRLVAPKN